MVGAGCRLPESVRAAAKADENHNPTIISYPCRGALFGQAAASSSNSSSILAAIEGSRRLDPFDFPSFVAGFSRRLHRDGLCGVLRVGELGRVGDVHGHDDGEPERANGPSNPGWAGGGGERGRRAGCGAELGHWWLRCRAVRVAGAQPRAAGRGAVGCGRRVAGAERLRAGGDRGGDGRRRLRHAEQYCIGCSGKSRFPSGFS